MKKHKKRNLILSFLILALLAVALYGATLRIQTINQQYAIPPMQSLPLQTQVQIDNITYTCLSVTPYSPADFSKKYNMLDDVEPLGHLVAEFLITNTGQEPLSYMDLIFGLELDYYATFFSPLFLTMPDLPPTLAPGESNTLLVSFDLFNGIDVPIPIEDDGTPNLSQINCRILLSLFPQRIEIPLSF